MDPGSANKKANRTGERSPGSCTYLRDLNSVIDPYSGGKATCQAHSQAHPSYHPHRPGIFGQCLGCITWCCKLLLCLLCIIILLLIIGSIYFWVVEDESTPYPAAQKNLMEQVDGNQPTMRMVTVIDEDISEEDIESSALTEGMNERDTESRTLTEEISEEDIESRTLTEEMSEEEIESSTLTGDQGISLDQTSAESSSGLKESIIDETITSDSVMNGSTESFSNAVSAAEGFGFRNLSLLNFGLTVSTETAVIPTSISELGISSTQTSKTYGLIYLNTNKMNYAQAMHYCVTQFHTDLYIPGDEEELRAIGDWMKTQDLADCQQAYLGYRYLKNLRKDFRMMNEEFRCKGDSNQNKSCTALYLGNGSISCIKRISCEQQCCVLCLKRNCNMLESIVECIYQYSKAVSVNKAYHICGKLGMNLPYFENKTMLNIFKKKVKPILKEYNNGECRYFATANFRSLRLKRSDEDDFSELEVSPESLKPCRVFRFQNPPNPLAPVPVQCNFYECSICGLSKLYEAHGSLFG